MKRNCQLQDAHGLGGNSENRRHRNDNRRLHQKAMNVEIAWIKRFTLVCYFRCLNVHRVHQRDHPFRLPTVHFVYYSRAFERDFTARCQHHRWGGDYIFCYSYFCDHHWYGLRHATIKFQFTKSGGNFEDGQQRSTRNRQGVHRGRYRYASFETSVNWLRRL